MMDVHTFRRPQKTGTFAPASRSQCLHRCNNSPSAIVAAIAGVRTYKSVPLDADRVLRSAIAVATVGI